MTSPTTGTADGAGAAASPNGAVRPSRRSARAAPPAVTVALVGAGPGDPELLTVRAAALLAAAEVVVADPGLPTVVLDRLDPAAEVLTGPEDPVGMATARARAGRRVVRLVHGDPLTAAGPIAEARALVKALARTPTRLEIVPGVAPLAAGPAYAGIPLPGPVTLAPDVGSVDVGALAGSPAPLVVGGTAADLGKVAAALLEGGRSGDTEVAVIAGATTTDQRTVDTTIDNLERDAGSLPGRLTAVVGASRADRAGLSWWESRPLFGWTVLVPRTREQAGELSDLLRLYGAAPLEVPTIAVEPPRTAAPMDRAIKGLVSGRYLWVVFTSVNAVRAIREKLEEYGLDARAFAGVRIAAVGEATAAALAGYGIRPELVPTEQQSSEGLLADWPDFDELLDPLDRVLLPRADIATETLVAGLKERGWAVDEVTAYRTVRAAPPPAPIREALKGGRIDAVVFTSSSTARNLVGIAGKPHDRTVIAVIGPQTAATVTELGLRVDVQAGEPSVPSLATALADFAARRAAEPAARPPTPTRRKR
jgi:uroporphyrinogen III methyltransferase/synthase